MAGDINQVILIGRIVRDSELRYSASGTALCNFSLAVGRRVKKGDQWTDEASFFDLTLWEKEAENLSKCLLKGTQVAVNGELRQERWTDKEGKNQSKVAVFVHKVQLLGGGKRDDAPRGEAPRGSPGGGESRDPSMDDFDNPPF